MKKVSEYYEAMENFASQARFNSEICTAQGFKNGHFVENWFKQDSGACRTVIYNTDGTYEIQEGITPLR